MRVVSKTLLLHALLLLSLSAQAGMGPQQRLLELSERIAATASAPELYLRRALIYAEVGEYRLAFADVDSAAQLGEKSRSPFVRAVLFYRLGQIDQALSLFDAYLEAYPQDPAAMLYRARILRDAGQLEAALRDYLAYLELRPEAEPGDTLMAARLIVTLAKQGHAEYRIDHALALLDKQHQALGHAPQLQRYAIELESARCHSAQALQRLHALHANARRSPRWHLQVAEQALLLDQQARASEALAQARERLLKRRPSASKAELEHRLSFVNVLLQQAQTQGLNPDNSDATRALFYPPATPSQHSHPAHEHVHAHDRGAHSHAPDSATHKHAGHDAPHSHAGLQGFEQPVLSQAGYAPDWAQSTSAFVACLTAQ